MIIRNRRLAVSRFEVALWRKVRLIIEAEHPELLSEETKIALRKEDTFDWKAFDEETRQLNKKYGYL